MDSVLWIQLHWIWIRIRVMLSILKRKKEKISVKKIFFFTFQKITHWIVKFFCSFTSILSYFYVGLRIRIRNKDSDSTSSWIRIQFGIQIHNNGNNAIPVPWQCCAVSTSPLPASARPSCPWWRPGSDSPPPASHGTSPSPPAKSQTKYQRLFHVSLVLKN